MNKRHTNGHLVCEMKYDKNVPQWDFTSTLSMIIINKRWTNMQKVVEKLEHLWTVGGNKMVKLLWKTASGYSKKLKVDLPARHADTRSLSHYLRVRDSKITVWGYLRHKLVRFCLKNKQGLVVIARAYNSSYQGGRDKRIFDWGQPKQTLVRPYLKMKLGILVPVTKEVEVRRS